MIYESVLVLHIIGALATALVGAYSFVVIWNNVADKYRLCATTLGALAGFEVLSGTMLSVLSPQVDAAALCGRIFLYLALVIITMALLFVRAKKISLAFPLIYIGTPIVASLTLFFSAIVAGF